MTPKRFLFAAVVFYALLSLFSPRFTPVRVVEVSALLLSRPWEIVFSSFFRLGQDSAAAPAAGGASFQDLWWRPVLAAPPGRPDLAVLGGRVCSPLSPETTRLKLDAGDDPPVRAGDPVVRGNILVGFVEAVLETGLVDVRHLRHRASRIVAAEVQEGIAGGRIVFAVGGKGPGENGSILLQYPSTRYGLTSGTRVFTASEFNDGNVPAGLFLGWLAVSSGSPGESKTRACVRPALEGDALARLGIVVPAERPGVAGRPRVPVPGLKRIPLSLSLPPGFVKPGVSVRVSAGLEKGIGSGDLIVSDGYCVGRISETGILASKAGLFLVPGETRRIVRLTPRGPETVEIEVVERSGSICRLKTAEPLADLEPDDCFFLPDESSTGGERYPLCSVVDPGDGNVFEVRCGNVRTGIEEYCLVAGKR